MNIVFKTRKLEKIFNSEKELIKAYGLKMAKIIILRMAFLRATSNLYRIPVTPPFRRHQLKGKYKGCFSVDVKHPFRLILRPVNDPMPVLDDGGFDLAKITDIEIMGMEDYH